jgi:hypothetical protein
MKGILKSVQSSCCVQSISLCHIRSKSELVSSKSIENGRSVENLTHILLQYKMLVSKVGDMKAEKELESRDTNRKREN